MQLDYRYHNDLTDAFSFLKRFPTLDVETERLLVRVAADGDEEARWSLVMGHLRFIARLARRFSAYYQVPPEDLFQEGIFGAYRAACRFDPTRGVRFLTVAGYWVRSSMQKCRPDYMEIRLGLHHIEGRMDKRRASRAAETEAEAGTETESSGLLNFAERAAHVMRPSDARWEAEGNRQWEEVFVDAHDDLRDAEEREAYEKKLAYVKQWIGEMSPATQNRLKYRLGLGREPETLEKVGARFGISKERIRQVEAKAIGIMQERARELDMVDGYMEAQR